MRLSGPLIALSLMLAAPAAVASSRLYAWSYGADTGLEGESGLETWVMNARPVDHILGKTQSFWDIWWGMTTSVTDHLELAAYTETINDPPGTWNIHLQSAQVQARWHLAEPFTLIGELSDWPMHGLGAKLIAAGETRLGDLDLVGNAGLQALPVWGKINGDVAQINLSAGAAYPVDPSLHVTLEAYSNVTPSGAQPFGIFVGPGIAYGKGKFWAAVDFAFGYSADSAVVAARGRAILGLVF